MVGFVALFPDLDLLAIDRDAVVVHFAGIVRDEERAAVGFGVVEVDIAERYAACVADKHALGGNRAEHPRLGVGLLLLGRHSQAILLAITALVVDVDVVQRYILDQRARNTADDRRIARVGIEDIDMADAHALHHTHGRTLGAAQTCTQAQEDRRIDNIAHRDIADHDILQMTAIDRLQGQATATLEDAVRDGDVLESATRLRAELDATRHKAVVGSLRLVALPGAIQDAATVVTAHQAIRDGHILRILEVAQAIRSLQHDGIVPGRIDRAVADADILAAVDIEAVAVRIDLHIEDAQVIDTRSQ